MRTIEDNGVTVVAGLEIDPNSVLARSTPEGEVEYHALVNQLQQVWPDLKAIPGQPSFSPWDPWNGIGVVGESDHDRATQTYRTYRALRFAGIPFVFLGAYRVYRTSRGNIVFLGRHPLPSWAHAWNALGLPCVVLMVVLFFAGLAEPLLR